MRSVSPYERFAVASPVTDARMRVHVLVAGETLTGLAHRYYGDWRAWRDIAERNNVSDPRALAPGARLLIPERQLELGSFESA